MNQAHYLMNSIPAQLRSRDAIKSALHVQGEALTYLQKTGGLVKQLNGEEGQLIRRRLRANTRNAQNNLRGLKEALR